MVNNDKIANCPFKLSKKKRRRIKECMFSSIKRQTHPDISEYMAVSTKYVGSRWQKSSSRALTPSAWANHKSNTAGSAAQYVPKNGTAPKIAAIAAERKRQKGKTNMR